MTRNDPGAAKNDSAETADPFSTAVLRRRVLAAWADSAARFREDANAEEDFALSGYRDRLIIELAQNAADAARRAGVQGRLLFRLNGLRLTAANTGAPLTAEGAESLSTLRASSKRHSGDATGRFGVGFSAVAAVSDDINVTSHGHALLYSQQRARDAVATVTQDNPALRSEVERRNGHVPTLRLPFPAPPATEPGYDTVVTLTLRSEDDRMRVRTLLEQTGEALLIAMEGLAEVVIDIGGQSRTLTRVSDTAGADFTTTVDGVGTRWRTVRRTGAFIPAMLADRPREERDHTTWVVQWAVPVTRDGSIGPLPEDVAPVVYAPTPSDTALSLPALLIATFPLSADRRNVQPGPATEFLIRATADAYAELMTRLSGSAALHLVPVATLSGGWFESTLREDISQRVRDTPFLETHEGQRVTPRNSIVLDIGTGRAAPHLAGVLAPIVTGLLPGDWDPRIPQLRALDIRRLDLAATADLLADRAHPPEWWSAVYAAIRADAAHGADLGELGALPIPLADGRLVRGARSVLLPPHANSGDLTPDNLAALGLRIVHPDAVDPLLDRLGATQLTAATALMDPLTEALVRDSVDHHRPEEISRAVLALASEAGLTSDDVPWLAELALRDEEDEYVPAGELLIAGAPLEAVIADDAPLTRVHPEVVDRHGTAVLRAAGALWTFTLRRASDVELTGEPGDLDEVFSGAIDGIEEWGDYVLSLIGASAVPPMIPELGCIADLDLVDDRKWREACALLADPDLRQTVTTAVRVVSADGGVHDVPSHAAWWLRTRARIDNRPLTHYRTADADAEIRQLFDELPDPLDAQLAHAIGIRQHLREVVRDSGGADDLLARLADPRRTLDRAALHAIWAALAQVEPDLVTPPERVRAVQDGKLVIADADDVLIVDQPDLLPLLAQQPLIFAPLHSAASLADVLDIPLASEEIQKTVAPNGSVREVPEVVHLFLPGAAQTYMQHDSLLMNGAPVEWVVVDGELHASTPGGLARALAWGAGRWERRHLLTAVLCEPQRASEFVAEAELE
ncbi:ATP-binding protein [Hoyosella sp. YIM 151337]|uniref:sacsin N-terminal ATP-binding-like domain-containing protein n=1 Tax=Hoyosella sp. YIM 151337 TaxID=2992742 RepID=UPI002236B52E|nr:ATP-binding protein [Hoyosella sp. YIM 151337]MCW4352920.1 ATP-binding protein [Hoyosella sp. YIM 151337]